MIDFSSTDSLGISTLIHPQYLSSVKHNTGYKSVSFGNGQNIYNIVDRNNHSGLDFHAPRLDKLVTEVTPATITNKVPFLAFTLIKIGILYFIVWGPVPNMLRIRTEILPISGAYQFVTGEQ